MNPPQSVIPSLFDRSASDAARANSPGEVAMIGVDASHALPSVYYSLFEFCGKDPERAFVCAPLAPPHIVTKAIADVGSKASVTPFRPALKDLPFPRNGIFLPGGVSTWTTRVIGLVSQSIADALSSPAPHALSGDPPCSGPLTVAAAERALLEEVSWAAHLGQAAVLLRPTFPSEEGKPLRTASFARAVAAAAETGRATSVLVELPLFGPATGWEVWRACAAAAKDSPKLGVALRLAVSDVAQGRPRRRETRKKDEEGDESSGSSGSDYSDSEGSPLKLRPRRQWCIPEVPNTKHGRAHSFLPCGEKPWKTAENLDGGHLVRTLPDGEGDSYGQQPAPPLWAPPLIASDRGQRDRGHQRSDRGHPYSLRPCPRLQRWVGANVRLVIVPLSVFVPNTNSGWRLRRAHQAVLHLFWEQGAMVVVRDDSDNQSSLRDTLAKLDACHLYISHLHSHRRPVLTPQAAFELPYRDTLQSPLQPLADHLDAQTYEVFEKDPVKYRNYRLAIARALSSLKQKGSILSTAVVAVVGAGRGPLVACALDAGRDAGVKVRVYALDKNPHAVATLRARARDEWGPQGHEVKVVDSDMRHWFPEETGGVDVLLSELLGSFGDNELSPECLALTPRLLSPQTGIAIPSCSQSLLSPVAAPAAWAAIQALAAAGRSELRETPFLVRLHRAWACAGPKNVFLFRHGRGEDGVGELERDAYVTFSPVEDAVVHGFAGYFRADLFDDISISIVPGDFSHGMYSWFPCFFPLTQPLTLRKGQELGVSMARRSTSGGMGGRGGVWYEWSVEVDGVSVGHVHNLRGKHATIGV